MIFGARVPHLKIFTKKSFRIVLDNRLLDIGIFAYANFCSTTNFTNNNNNNKEFIKSQMNSTIDLLNACWD